MRVVATAGHVDHGKSSLVLALTGTDPDRFPEEKARGLTIDLGFAFCTLDSGDVVGFVDVPGHVRFVKNMLAGVGAIDIAVLVVAATEGWMPQSEEHLRILELLGVRHGLVVLTKTALVDDDTLELAQLDIAEHTEGTMAETWAVLPVDTPTGAGVAEVREALAALLDRVEAPADRGRPRLWVDRAFAPRGAGTVVTGTLVGGSLHVDDVVLVEPGHRRARIRGIESHHTASTAVGPGARVALNLAGISHHDITRGDAVVLPGQWAEAAVVDVAVTLVPGAHLGARARLAAHVGSGEHRADWRAVPAGAAEPGTAEPGAAERGTAAPVVGRLRLSSALPLAPGDRIVLRSTARNTTVAGAVVLDVAPPRRTRDVLTHAGLDPVERIRQRSLRVSVPMLMTEAGLGPEEAVATLRRLVDSGRAVRIDDETAYDADRIRILGDAAAERVAQHHRTRPDERGLPLTDLARVLQLPLDDARAVATARSGLVVDAQVVRDATHLVHALDDPAARALLDALLAAPFSPPAPGELGTPTPAVRALVRDGLVVDLDGIVFAADALEQARHIVSAQLAAQGTLTVADIRDALGSTRKYVLAIVNHLDRSGVTRRRGDERIAGPRAVLPPTAGA